jgi:hypothetical protein
VPGCFSRSKYEFIMGPSIFFSKGSANTSGEAEILTPLSPLVVKSFVRRNKGFRRS